MKKSHFILAILLVGINQSFFAQEKSTSRQIENVKKIEVKPIIPGQINKIRKKLSVKLVKVWHKTNSSSKVSLKLYEAIAVMLGNDQLIYPFYSSTWSYAEFCPTFNFGYQLAPQAAEKNCSADNLPPLEVTSSVNIANLGMSVPLLLTEIDDNTDIIFATSSAKVTIADGRSFTLDQQPADGYHIKSLINKGKVLHYRYLSFNKGEEQIMLQYELELK
ncbi:hypothetical protein [Soonwooa sp.]|uniref:hypothetical protein n=1 Tax=Soonwooa sp. TaxID=1938592 RepID=UPI00260DCA41|nr:hypothetical protein [Soonwooa sp.]